MIETFKDRTTGEVFQNQTVLCEFYVFWREDMLRVVHRPKRGHDTQVDVKRILDIMGKIHHLSCGDMPLRHVLPQQKQAAIPGEEDI